MLILGRQLDEPIVINDNIFIKVVRAKSGGGFKIAIDAPKDVKVMRGELHPGIEAVEERWKKSLKQ